MCGAGLVIENAAVLDKNDAAMDSLKVIVKRSKAGIFPSWPHAKMDRRLLDGHNEWWAIL